MPYFIERFLDIHEDGCREMFDIFGVHGRLGKLEDFICGGFMFPSFLYYL